jgi:hypothetical protein
MCIITFNFLCYPWNIRYKVEVEFRFQDSKIRTVVWDREYEELIGNSAEELKAIMLKVGYQILHTSKGTLFITLILQ